MFFIIISALHVSGGFSAHHQEFIKLYVQPWVLSCLYQFIDAKQAKEIHQYQNNKRKLYRKQLSGTIKHAEISN
jgi:hypothetical protein